MSNPISRLAYFFSSSCRFAICSLTTLFFFPLDLARRLYNLTHASVMSAITKRKSRHHVGKKDSMLDKLGVRTQVDATCPICQEPIGSKNPEGITEGWSLLPCGHRFGSYCIKHYLNVVAEDRPSCPVCRQIAYHACGHPVLPVLLKTNGSKADKIVESADLLIEEMKHSRCAYCQTPRGGLRLVGSLPARTKQSGTKWKSLIGWVRILSFTKKRRTARRNRLLNQAPVPISAPTRAAAPLPTSSNNSQTALPTLSLQAQPSSQGQEVGGWSGPWIDPFPKARDHDWEKWWKQQEPCGA